MIQLLGIIGDPIRHSLSPAMQNAALRKARLSILYVPIHVLPQDLASFIRQAPSLGFLGFNITIPHKERALKHMDWVSPGARAIGAVNTVLIRGKKKYGDNTDALGYRKSLRKETRFDPRGKKILILGAGGAARAVLYALRGARKIYICNRTTAKAKRLAKDFQIQNKTQIVPFNPGSLKEVFPRVDLLVNATSIGLGGSRFKNLPLKSLPPKAIVSDLVYRPLKTPLLREAKKLGLRTHTGLGMLLYQGALSFQIWTGKRPDLRAMKHALLDGLS